MYKYAVLGGTGATGSAIITQLLEQGSPGTLHIYARSEERLFKKIPQLEQHIQATVRVDKSGSDLLEEPSTSVPAAPHVKLFIGGMSHIDLLSACLTDVDVVYQTLAANVSEPDISIAQDAARVCVDAISLCRKRSPDPSTYVAPTILFLSSASCSPKLSEKQGIWAHWLLHDCALYYIYHDLEIAQRYLESVENTWIPHVIVCPNGLSEGAAVGHTIGLEPSDVAMLSYADLGGAMIEIAEGKDKWEGKMVQASGQREMENPQWGVLVKYICVGLLCRFARPLWSLGRWAGWW